MQIFQAQKSLVNMRPVFTLKTYCGYSLALSESDSNGSPQHTSKKKPVFWVVDKAKLKPIYAEDKKPE